MDWHLRAERTCPLCPLLCLSPYHTSTLHLGKGKHTWWVRERINFPSCDPAHKTKYVWKGNNTMNTTFMPSLSQPAGGCIWSMQCFRKKKLEPGLKTSLPAFLYHLPTRPSGAGRACPSCLFAGAFLGAGPQQSGVSMVTYKIFKIQFWRHHLTKDVSLFRGYRWKPAGPVTKCMVS